MLPAAAANHQNFHIIFLQLAKTSVMEQADAGKCHSNPIFVAGFDHIVVADGAAGLRDVFHAAFMRAFNVVSEGEESV